MGQEYVLDLEGVFGGKGEVLVGVTLRVDDGRCAGLLVSYEVGSVGEAGQIELLKDHVTTASVCGVRLFITRAPSRARTRITRAPSSARVRGMLPRLRNDPEIGPGRFPTAGIL